MSPRGETISDRYQIEDRLGSGGMSSVFRATDTILERTVAVKILAEHLSDDERFVARFRREALAVAKLVHPNIVQVYDTGIDAGRHYIVMEYVRGKSGAQILQSKGTLPVETAVEIGVQACSGLDYAHRHGIIHRDVKPGNLMVIGGPAGGGGDMSVKLADFGIARATEQTRITQVGSVVGTAAYLAPEQARGDEAAPSSDVYALGVVLYQFLTGRLPYEGASLAELAVRQQSEQPLPPSSYNDEVPQAVGEAVLVALESDPEARFAAAGELADALRRGLDGESPASSEARTRVVSGGSEPTAATRHLPRTQSTRRPPPRRRQPQRAQRPPAGQAPRKPGQVNVVRTVAAVVALLLLAAVVAMFVVLATDNNTSQRTNVEDIVKDNVNDQIDALRNAIEDNTQQ
ncbi:MAG: serine/threonine protein kinase [Solirubrobacterales bacterium]|nr:serine/threonine protein kinase [Solirubrobacterales bacterium]